MELNEFKLWLKENYNYTDLTVKDIVSRMKRANSIIEFFNDDIYIYQLSLAPEMKDVSPSVKSQIKRAVKLYMKYLGEMENNK